MKTSLVIDDSLFRAAQEEAHRTRKTLSETLSHWARVGWEALRKRKSPSRKIKPLNLGGQARINLASRKAWMDELDE